MRNTRKSGQILRSKKRPRPTPRSGRGSWTNSNTCRQIPARGIEADSARAVWVPDPSAVQLIRNQYEEGYHVQRFSIQCVRWVLRGPKRKRYVDAGISGIVSGRSDAI